MAIDSVLNLYDRAMYQPRTARFYEDSDFYNFGYWNEDTHTAKQASENLMEKLLELLPRRSGMVLDVACGKGATTRYLLKHWSPADTVAINLSCRQLETTRQNAPGCGCAAVDAARLSFADNTFDTVLCVEAAFHFRTREQFLLEAFRVLKPGGSLVLSDILYTKWAHRRDKLAPKPNYLENSSAYASLLQRLGFEQLRIVDTTEESWRRFQRNVLRHSFAEGRVPLFFLMAPAFTRQYLLVGARKPVA